MGSHESEPESTRDAEVTAALDALRHVVRALRLSSTAVEKAHGVSGAQLFVLGELATGKNFSIAELAARTATDPSSVSVVVGRLVERGLAVRRASPNDARRAEIAITPAGSALLNEAPAPIQRKLIAAITEMPEDERAALTRGLGRVAAAMGAPDGPPPMFFEGEPASRRSRKE
ncbi:MarR family winged helix-turn-helix transcriptional regulator [Polyangium sp. 15x6]|uniref:MarR family winged helix-turn-helix transcriptional regulator n=1 Tax=Polyangium sp. 15x6 TaxID=3042687 RepID=UPI00249C85B7|nr:MarR family winged helix-turn-helix transcriptional regulator [Polyangium sp. 15x6]MDI3283920.1 MarR family winged helix-turn-helix transcriptional regulator [Polyangium sp. 15x6]